MGKKKPPEKKAGLGWRRLLGWGLKAGLLALLLGALTLVGGYFWFARGLPDIRSVDDWRPAEVSRIYASDGTVVAEFFAERRTVVSRKQIPEVLIQAVLSAEDGDFYRHEGLDYEGMLRALYNSARAGRVTGSGSTITQQTVKNLLLTPAKRFERKAREVILARRLEKHLSKDDILTIYLNAIYLGHGRYGVEEAARFYWDKPAKALSLSEAATLAGLIQSPERISPRKHPKRARQRRAYVLKQMEKNGYIDAAARKATEKAPITVADWPRGNLPEAAWFVDVVRRRLTEALGKERVERGGLSVTTTLDLGRQRAAQAALRGGLQALDARRGFGAARAKVGKGKRWRKARKKALRGKAPEAGKVVPGRIASIGRKEIRFDLGVGEGVAPRRAFTRFARKKGLPYAVGDVLSVKVRADGPRHPEAMKVVPAGAPQGAMVVLDPQSRDVLALIGGWDMRDHPYNRAVDGRRQPGSLFKTFVWGAAYEGRRFSPSSLMVDAPETWRIGRGKWWKPKNYSGKFRNEPVALELALAKSINSVAVKLAHEVGIPKVHDFARRAGVHSDLVDNLTIALGSSEVSPLEITNAYATLAADGRHAEPRFVVSISDRAGPVKTALTREPPLLSRIDPEICWLLRSTLRAVVTQGSARRLKGFSREVVGKTGTSNNARDTWFVGLLPEVVVTAWVGFDSPKPLGGKEAGSKTALPLVADYLKSAEAKGPRWESRPEGILARRIDPASGLLARAGAEGAKEAWFLEGTEPKDFAAAADELDANSFVMREAGASTAPAAKGAALDVPRIGVAPLPEHLRPVAPVEVDGVDDEDSDDEDRPD